MAVGYMSEDSGFEVYIWEKYTVPSSRTSNDSLKGV